LIRTSQAGQGLDFQRAVNTLSIVIPNELPWSHMNTNMLNLIMPLLGVLIGSILTGTGSVIRTRLERKRLIARALSELLEIRHQMMVFDRVLNILASQFQIPAEAMPAVRSLVSSTVPLDSKIQQRYEDVVTVLSGEDPLLGFYLRARCGILTFTESMRTVGIDNGLEPEFIEKIGNELSSLIIPELNKVILLVGRKHSIITWWKLKGFLSESDELPPNLLNFMNTVHSLAQAEA